LNLIGINNLITKSGRFYLYLNTDRIKDKEHIELEYEVDFINAFRYVKNATKKDYKKLGDIWAKWRSNVLICRNDTNILNPLNWTMSQRKTIGETSRNLFSYAKDGKSFISRKFNKRL
jgi:hypothetical protein